MNAAQRMAKQQFSTFFWMSYCIKQKTKTTFEFFK